MHSCRYQAERQRVSAMLRVRRAPTPIALHADFVQCVFAAVVVVVLLLLWLLLLLLFDSL